MADGVLPQQIAVRIADNLPLARQVIVVVVLKAHGDQMRLAAVGGLVDASGGVVLPQHLVRAVVGFRPLLADKLAVLVVVPVRNKPGIVAVNQLTGGVVLIILHAPVKPSFLSQAVHDVVAKMRLRAVFIDESRQPARAVKSGLPREPAFGLRGRVAALIPGLRGLAAVGAGDGDDVARDVVFPAGSCPAGIFANNPPAARVVRKAGLHPFFVQDFNRLPVAVVAVGGFETGTVGKRGKQAGRVPFQRLPPTRRVFGGAGLRTLIVGIMIAAGLVQGVGLS
ncbi:hypothetical protein, partial [Rahnella laticis]|uniref:hypothetical protein n=1 Tax=Rahnella laticis TaxID=2787622 RepID=UPI001E5374C7